MFTDKDLSGIRDYIHERCGYDIAIDFEEATRSDFNRKHCYQIWIGNVSIFKAPDDRLKMVVYDVESKERSIPEERYGRLETALNRIVDLMGVDGANQESK